mgnify:CR=1 FL=1
MKKENCDILFRSEEKYYEQLPEIVKKVSRQCDEKACFDHVNTSIIPSRDSIIEILDLLKDLLFPGYFGNQELSEHNLDFHIGEEINNLYRKISNQITRSIRHECSRHEQTCKQCIETGCVEAVEFLKKIPEIRKKLALDVKAALDGDPAAKDSDEVIFSYPGLIAIMIYRIAHEFYVKDIPLIPRIMSEYAHSMTGIDIHPGARIGNSFFIDHGTGIVVGETTDIGDNVRIYQGVTLGALSLKKDPKTGKFKDFEKRHPTIEDNVIIYANAIILGGKTVIGKNSVVGGNVWLTESIPPNNTVMVKSPELIVKKRG